MNKYLSLDNENVKSTEQKSDEFLNKVEDMYKQVCEGSISTTTSLSLQEEEEKSDKEAVSTDSSKSINSELLKKIENTVTEYSQISTTGNEEQDFELLLKAPEFPIEIFPEKIQNLILEIERIYHIRTTTVACLISYLSIVINGRYNTRIADDLKAQGCNEYVIVVANSGAGKSQIMDHFLKPVRHIYTTQVAHFEKKKKELENKRKNTDKVAYTDGTYYMELDELEKQAPIGFHQEDFTIESLSEVFRKTPFNTAYSDELEGLLGSLDAYQDNKRNGKRGRGFSKLLSLWDGGTEWHVKRIRSSRNMYVPASWLSLFGGIQPALFLDAFTTRDLDSGFLGRCVVFKEYISKFYGLSTDIPPISEESKKIIEDIAYYFLTDMYNPPKDENDRVQSIYIPMSNDGKDKFYEWYNRRGEEWFNLNRSGLFNKISMHTTRFILMLHILYEFLNNKMVRNNYEIPCKIVERGIVYGEWLAKCQMNNWNLIESYRQEEADMKYIELEPRERMVANAIVDLNNVEFTCKELKSIIFNNEGIKLDEKVIGQAIRRLNNTFGRDVFTKSKDRKGLRRWSIQADFLAGLKERMQETNVRNVNNVQTPMDS